MPYFPKPDQVRAYPKVGKYLCNPTTPTAPGAFAGPLGRMFLVPLLLPRPVVIDRIGLRANAAVAGSFMRVGAYADDGDGDPGVRLFDAGQLDCSSTGWKEAVVAVTLPEGLIWLAGATQGVNPNVIGHTSNTQNPILHLLGWTEPTWDNGSSITHAIYVDGVTGALPDPAGAVTSALAASNQNTSPRIAVRCA